MLEKVRNSLQSGFTYVLVAGLTVIFMFFFGMPTQTCSGGAGRSRALLANVGGEAIHTEDVNLIYNRIFGTDRSDDKAKYRKRRASALRNLILIELFADRARAQGLRVSTDELRSYIQDPTRNVEFRYSYGQDGSFNGHYYKAYVKNQLRASLNEYEAFKRDELLARKYLAAHAAQAPIPSAELDSVERIRNTELNLAFVKLDTEKLRASVEVSDEELQTFLDENSKEIEKYYEEHEDSKYSSPAELLVRRVYIPRPGSSAEKSKRAKANKKWKEAKRRVLDEGEDLGAVAEELGEQYPGKSKGLMPWSTTEDMNQKVKEALDGADVGAVEEVVTSDAYKLVKLEDRKPKKTTPLADVRTEIAKRLVREKRVDGLLKEAKNKLLAEARKTGSLTKALESLQSSTDRQVWKELSVDETGAFTLESEGPPPQLAARMGGNLSGFGSWYEIPKIGTSKELAVTAFKELDEDNPVAKRPYEVGGSTFLVRLKSRETADDSKETSKGESGPSLSYKLENQKINELLGRWTALFGSMNGRIVPPLEEYGPWIDRQLQAAVDEGSVSVHEKNSPVAGLLARDLKPGGDIDTPAAKKKGKSINLKMGGGKQGNKMNLKKALKKKMRQMKKKKEGSGGTSEGDESGE